MSGFAENVEIPETFVDYSATPREYSLSAIQMIVRVHTRVSDLYNGPFDQLEEQMRLTIEGIKERQEWDLINSKKFGLLNSVDPAMRISTRYGAPTPDDLDDLLAQVWKKPAFFLAHPSVAAFSGNVLGRPSATTSLFSRRHVRGCRWSPTARNRDEQPVPSNQHWNDKHFFCGVGEADQGSLDCTKRESWRNHASPRHG